MFVVTKDIIGYLPLVVLFRYQEEFKMVTAHGEVRDQ